MINKINNLEVDIEKINNYKIYIYDCLIIYPVYMLVKERINKENQNHTANMSTLEIKKADAEIVKNNINNRQTEIQKLRDGNIIIDTLIKNTPDRYRKISLLNAEIKEKLKEEFVEKSLLQEYLQLSDEQNRSKELIIQNLTYFEADSYINIKGLSKENQEGIARIEQIIPQIESLSNKIRDYEIKIAEEIQIKEDVKSLIRVGIRIVEQSQSEFCPLCQSEYETFQNLTDRISTNPVLSERESTLLKNKSSEEINLEAKKDLLDVLKKGLENEITEKLQHLEVEILKNTKHIDSARQTLFSIEKIITNKTAGLQAYTKETENLSEKEFLLKLKNQKKTNLTAIQIEEVKLGTEINRQTVLNKEIQTLTDQNKTSVDIILSAKENPEYNKILEFGKAYFIEDIDINQIQDLINKESEKVRSIETQIINYNSDIDKLNELLLPVKVSDIENNLADKEFQLGEILESLSTFNEFTNKINVPKEDMDRKERVVGFIQEYYWDVNKKIALQKNIIEEYQKLEKSKEHILPYLKQVKTKEDIMSAEESLNRHVSLKRDMATEKQGLAAHIQTHINSFFHKELIVDIYSKIDPHPDYKEIDFTCNFDDTYPKLTVFVKTKGE